MVWPVVWKSFFYNAAAVGGEAKLCLCNAAAAGGETKPLFYDVATGGGFNEIVEQLKSSNNVVGCNSRLFVFLFFFLRLNGAMRQSIISKRLTGACNAACNQNGRHDRAVSAFGLYAYTVNGLYQPLDSRWPSTTNVVPHKDDICTSSFEAWWSRPFQPAGMHSPPEMRASAYYSEVRSGGNIRGTMGRWL